MNRQAPLQKITAVLAWLESYLKLNSGQNLNDAAVLFEDACVPLLNCVFGLQLKNANAEVVNFPAADLICRATRVHVLAQRRAFPVASYLAYALAQLEVKAQLLDGVGGMLPDVLRQIGSGELLLVTSFKDYSPEVVAAAAAAHTNGVPVVAITDFALSPLRPHARVCFELGQGSNAAFRSLMAPLCLAQALVVSVGHRLVAPRKATRKNKP